MTGMSILGKMSVGVRRMTAGLNNRMRMARTTNVYGRLRASLTIHMDVSFPGCGVHPKIRRNRACLQFLPSSPKPERRSSNRHSFRPWSCSMHDETARSHLFFGGGVVEAYFV